VIRSALQYKNMGWAVIPIPFQKKAPTKQGWTKWRLDEDEIRQFFNGKTNIGVLLGEPSGYLVDIDLDCPEAVRLAPMFLPKTGAIFGRAGAPKSHWLYYVVESEHYKKYIDPSSGETFLEYRGNSGKQSVIPPSVHPNGETVKWHIDEGPQSVSQKELQEATNNLAAAVLLTKYWPARGSRDDAAMALCGSLLRAGWTAERVDWFVPIVAAAAGDEEAASRAKGARTAAKLQAGEPVSGWPSLAGFMGQKVVDRVRQWLNSKEATEEDESSETPGKKTVPQRLIELSGGDTFFKTSLGVAYCAVTMDGHREIYRVGSRGYRLLLSQRFYTQTGKSPNPQAVYEAMDVLEARAKFDGETAEVYTRIAPGPQGSVYIDPGWEDWRAIHIKADGWRIVDQPAVYFQRPSGMLPMAEPLPGLSLVEALEPFVNIAKNASSWVAEDAEDAKNPSSAKMWASSWAAEDAEDAEDDLLPYLENKKDKAWAPLVMFAVGCMNPKGPYPVLSVIGEQGSAKSTLCRMLGSIIDPRQGGVRSLPTKVRDMMIAAASGHLITYDNVSTIRQDISDALCRIATGGGFGVRKHYSDDEETIFDVCRPQVLNGITRFVESEDLRDRLVSVRLARIEQYKEEETLWAEFEAQRPYILGSLLDCVSASIRNRSEVSTAGYRLRMADFAKWAAAGAEAAGIDAETCLEVYSSNKKEAVAGALSEDPFAQAVIEIAEEDGEWVGSASELLTYARDGVEEDVLRSKAWPKTPNQVGVKLRRIVPALREVGVFVDTEVRYGTRKEKYGYMIKKTQQKKKKAKTSSASSASPAGAPGRHLHAVDEKEASSASSANVERLKL